MEEGILELNNMELNSPYKERIITIYKEEFMKLHKSLDGLKVENIHIEQMIVVALCKALSKIAYENNIMVGRLPLLLSDDVIWGKFKLRLNEISSIMKEKGL